MTRAVRTSLVLALAGAAALPGCVQRRIRITSEPTGALVTLNDVQIGHTPVEAAFKFYGTYDVRLELDGFETISTGKTAKAPVWQYPFVDIAAMAVPFNFEDTVAWHFDMEPWLERARGETTLLEEVGERARALRDQIAADDQAE
jgi:hypothetical protein